jgi:hypothetical protein
LRGFMYAVAWVCVCVCLYRAKNSFYFCGGVSACVRKADAYGEIVARSVT